MSKSNSRSPRGSASFFVIVCTFVVAMLAFFGQGIQKLVAASVTPTVIPGANNTGKGCDEVLAGSTEFRISGPLSNGIFTNGVLVVTLSNVGVTPHKFDFTTNLTVVKVVVKDGVDGANLYDYAPVGTTGDTDLRTPNEGSKGVSHINFCYLSDTPTNTPTMTSTPTGTDTPTNTPTMTSTPECKENCEEPPTATPTATVAAVALGCTSLSGMPTSGFTESGKDVFLTINVSGDVRQVRLVRANGSVLTGTLTQLSQGETQVIVQFRAMPNTIYAVQVAGIDGQFKPTGCSTSSPTNIPGGKEPARKIFLPLVAKG